MRTTKFENSQVLFLKKMMYDQRQKKMSKSINNEKKKFKMLKKFQTQHSKMNFSKTHMN